MALQSQGSSKKLGNGTEAQMAQKQVMAKLWREMERPGNQNCADCDQSDPEWASITFGILVCTQCASAHRSLGVNVSVIRSITLDQWDASQLVNIQNFGNKAANEIYEYSLPGGVKPNPNSPLSARTNFIRSKYLDKAFVNNGTVKKTDRHRRNTSSLSSQQESSVPLRLVDYFVILGRGARTCELKFEPKILDRLPIKDHGDFPLPPNSLEPFVFPEDITLSSIHLPPTRVGFTLTSAVGTRQYVVGLLFWEIMTPMEIVELEASCATDDESRKNLQLPSGLKSGPNLTEHALFSPKCILVVSHWPFLNVFEKWLSMIYRISLSNAPLPIERFISNFIFEVPVPPPGKVAVQFSVADQTLRLSRPPPNQLPLCDCRMMTLFQCLNLNNIIALITAMLSEQKIVICSSQRSVLLDVCEAACALIFPLSWQGVYMPVLPRKLVEFIHAPVPFIAGISSSYLQGPNPISIPSEVIFFDLDANEVSMPAPDTLPSLPEKPLKKLLDSLRPLVSGVLLNGRDDIDLAFPFSEQLAPIERFGEGGLIVSDAVSSPVSTRMDSTKKILNRFKRGSPAKPTSAGGYDSPSKFDTEAIRELFLRFMVKLLGKYRQHLIPSENRTESERDAEDTRDSRSQFDRASFLRDVPDSHRPLLSVLTETQMFERFIRDRWTPSCAANDPNALPEVQFFDECIVAKMNRSNFHMHRSTPFLDDRSNDITTTFVSPFPNQAGISGSSFEYDQFPQLHAGLIGPLRTVEPLVDKERRQMVSTLARRVNTDLMKGRIVPQFQSWDRLRKAAIVIQRHYRGYKPRRAYRNLRRAAKFIDARVYYLRLRKAALFTQAAFRVYLNRAHRAFLQHAAASTIISSALTAYLNLKYHQKKLASTIALQTALRTFAAVSQSRRITSAIIRVQSKVRMWLQRRRYLKTVALIVKTQARFRGIRVRHHQAIVIQEGIASCRTKLLELWSVLHSPLNYRSQFWVILEKPSYMSWMMHIEEVHRLQNDLRTRSTESNKRAKELLTNERKQIYTTLAKVVPKAIREEYFLEFGLKGGHRKKRLSETLWMEQGKERLSSETLLAIVSKIGTLDLHIIEMEKRERIRRNLHSTTLNSLQAVSRLHLRIALLKAETRAALSTNAHLSIRNQILLQQARSILNQSRRPSLRPGYRPQYDESKDR